MTGAAGLAGGEIVRAFVHEGREVVGLVRNPSRRPQVPPGARVELVDCADPAALDRVLVDGDILVHVAGIHLAESLARVDHLSALERLVVVSSASVLSPRHPMASRYEQWEELVMKARPDAVLIRPTMIYGSERDRNVHRVVLFARRLKFLPLFGSGRGLIQPIHYEDLARIVVRAADSIVGRALGAGGGSRVSLEQAGRLIFASLSLPTRLLRFPIVPALAAARGWDRASGQRTAEKLERLEEDRVVDNSALLQLLAIGPRPFEVGLQDLVHRLRSAGYLR